MLTPLLNSTSLTSTSSNNITTVSKHCPFLAPDFFKPLVTEVGLSCTYSTEFYEAFGQSSHSSQHSELAMLVLEYMTPHDKARLPLFNGASDRYVKQVLPAILEKLASEDIDHDTLATKFHIMNCAAQLGYLTRSSLVFQDLVRLHCVSLVGMDLRNAYLAKASLRGTDLRGVNLQGADLSGAHLLGTNLSSADLSRSNLIDTNLCLSNLREANLSNANLRATNLFQSDLRRTDLSGADLRCADLQGADLSQTNLSKANLCGANLHGANLRKANLNEAILNGADLRKADLRQATLRGTDLSQIDLSETRLSENDRFMLLKIAKATSKK